MLSKVRGTWLVLISVLLIIFAGHANQVHADSTSVTIDGNLSDWTDVAKTTTSSKAQVALKVEGDYLYYYVDMNPTGAASAADNNWAASSKFGMQPFTLTAGGSTFTLTPTATTNGSSNVPTTAGDKLRVSTNVYSSNSGSYNNDGNNIGYVVAKSGTGSDGYDDAFEGQVALSDLQLGKTDGTEFKLSGGGYNMGSYTATTTAQANTSASSSSSSTASSTSASTGNSGSNYTSHPDIVIDGAFDDWAGVTKTKIRESGDDFNVKEGAMLQYDGDLYIYINMSPNLGTGYAALQPSGYDLTIGGVKYNLTVENADGSTYQALTTANQTRSITMGIYNNSTGKWDQTPSGVSGRVTRVVTATGGQSDVFEIKLPLTDFDASNQTGQTITLQNKNLGDETMTVTGGSTGPVLLAASGFIIALFGVWQWSRNKRRQNADFHE